MEGLNKHEIGIVPRHSGASTGNWQLPAVPVVATSSFLPARSGGD
jgi:hypothetical protein